MEEQVLTNLIDSPRCYGMMEDPSATEARQDLLFRLSSEVLGPLTALDQHLLHRLAYTIGSALGSQPPSNETCLETFTATNEVGLTVGARAWSKHHHRSMKELEGPDGKKIAHQGWWGRPSGPVSTINEKALALFWKIMNNATWRNLHWLPHNVLVYEVRIEEGYGLRWSQDQSLREAVDGGKEDENYRSPSISAMGSSTVPWRFRGFVEPMMENGHESGWRH